MSEMVTLLCPEGAFDYPVSHGTREYYPYRADHTSLSREFGGPWLVDVPLEIYHHFLGVGGFTVYAPPVTTAPSPPPVQEPPPMADDSGTEHPHTARGVRRPRDE